MAASSKLRVFVASPGDLRVEREEARECVARVNAELAHVGGPEFALIGWEIVRGTAKRPQEAINELVDGCDYMICLFKKNWGSEPGGPLAYTSGTEEELFTALLGLGREEHPMRDVWLAFMDTDGVNEEVSELKNQIQERHALLYDSASDLQDFRRKLEQRLHGWVTVGPKEPRNIDLLPRSGRDVLGADRLRRRGERLVELGHADLGTKTLHEAVDIGGPPEKVALARVLARQGRVGDAHELVGKAIDQLVKESADLHTPSVAEAYAYQANLLRRERKNFEAKQRLTQALGLLLGEDEYTQRVRCRILDDLGLVHHNLKEYKEATRRFTEALKARKLAADPYAVAQSEINLARTCVAMGDLEKGNRYSEAALKALSSLSPGTVHANAYLLRAQVVLRLGDSLGAVEFARMSLTLNEQFSNNRGSAMAHNVLAQAFRHTGQIDESRKHAELAVDINNRTGMESPSVLHVLAEKTE
jgi:tetratricopeptide (TPR) repeat protein